MDSAQAQALKEQLLGQDFNGWKIVDFFGNGKSAVVMKAEKGGETSAIKVFHNELVERFGKATQLARIQREVGLVDAEHPNLVRILGGGESAEGHLFVQMEALAWPNLAQVLAKVPDESVFPLLSQVASAARYLENRGLVHRDIKPENIAVSPDFSTAKLLDLGVLKPFGVAGLTDVDFRPFIGTLRYSPPEFLLRQEEDTVDGWRAVNFYQLGAVLHDLLTKVELFKDYSEPFALLSNAVQETTPEVTGFDPTLVRLADACLLKSPEARRRLVSWGDFEAKKASDSPATDAIGRIRNRQDYFKELVQRRSHAEPIAGEANRLLRKKLEDVIQQLSLSLAVLLSALKVFPLRQTSTKVHEDVRSCSLDVTFVRDDSIGMSQSLSVSFRLELASEEGGKDLWILYGTAQMESGHTIFGDEQLGKGPIGELANDDILEPFMMAVLDAAYDFLATKPA
jgi:serine/threonine protein kinase